MAAEEVAVFDPTQPPLPEPGKVYRLVIDPGKDARQAVLLFKAGNGSFREHEGKAFTNIESLTQQGHGDLSFESQGGIPNLDIVDYDNDGYLDFRVVAGWGTGGTWYNYYRYDGTKYVPWQEPMDLGINHIEPEKGFASSHWRSGPSWSAAYFTMKGSRFSLYEMELFDQAKYRRPIVPKEVPDNHYVLITETIAKDRIVHRKIVETNPWENEGTQRTVFDQKVDEAIKKEAQ